MVLGEHGFIGLILYLIILGLSWLNLSRVIRLTKDAPGLLWAKDMASALQVGILGFMVGGALLPMAYYDGFMSLLAMTVPLRALVEAKFAPARPRWMGARRPADEPTPSPALALKPYAN